MSIGINNIQGDYLRIIMHSSIFQVKQGDHGPPSSFYSSFCIAFINGRYSLVTFSSRSSTGKTHWFIHG